MDGANQGSSSTPTRAVRSPNPSSSRGSSCSITTTRERATQSSRRAKSSRYARDRSTSSISSRAPLSVMVEFVVQVDQAPDRDRCGAVEQRLVETAARVGYPRGLRKRPGVRSDDSRHGDRARAIRHLIGDGSRKGPTNPTGGTGATTGRVVERALHDGGQAFSYPFLNDKLTEVR